MIHRRESAQGHGWAVLGASVAAVCTILATGCTGGSAASGSQASNGPIKVVPPSVLNSNTLALVNDDQKLAVGDGVAHWSQVFPRPIHGSFAVKEVPRALSASDLTAQGWETATKGFGALINSQKVALAMVWESKDHAARAASINALYTKVNQELPVQKVASGGVSYLFWEDHGIRMMLFTQRLSEDSFNITVSIGEDQLMDSLRAGPIQARDDLAALYPNEPAPQIIRSVGGTQAAVDSSSSLSASSGSKPHSVSRSSTAGGSSSPAGSGSTGGPPARGSSPGTPGQGAAGPNSAGQGSSTGQAGTGPTGTGPAGTGHGTSTTAGQGTGGAPGESSSTAGTGHSATGSAAGQTSAGSTGR